MKVYELKVGKEHFYLQWTGRISFEICKKDQDFQVGDTLVLKEFNQETGTYTGKECWRSVAWVLDDTTTGVESGYVVLSTKVL